MVTTDSGREFRTQTLADEKGESVNYWTCLTCGALVGPRIAHRTAHDEWHTRHGD